MQKKGPQREEKEKIKGADAQAIQIKGPQREEKDKIKGAGAEALYRSRARRGRRRRK